MASSYHDMPYRAEHANWEGGMHYEAETLLKCCDSLFHFFVAVHFLLRGILSAIVFSLLFFFSCLFRCIGVEDSKRIRWKATDDDDADDRH